MVQNQEKSTLDEFIDELPIRSGSIACSGLSGSEKGYLIHRQFSALSLPTCVVTAQARDAERLFRDIRFFSAPNDGHLHYLPPHHILPYKTIGYHSETAARRIGTLYHAAAGSRPFIMVTSVEALLQRVIPKSVLCDWAELLIVGEETDREVLVEKLLDGGYTRTAIVEEPGDFSVRGAILDLYSPLYADPLRIEWFGDQVEDIRFFSAASQRKTGTLDEAVVLPASEAILDRTRFDTVVERLRRCAVDAGLSAGQRLDAIRRLETEGVYPEVESLLSIFYEHPESMIAYLPDSCLIVLDSPGQLGDAAESMLARIQGNYGPGGEAALCAAG